MENGIKGETITITNVDKFPSVGLTIIQFVIYERKTYIWSNLSEFIVQIYTECC